MNRILILLAAIVATCAAGLAGFLLAKPGDTSARLAAQEKITSLEKQLQEARTEIAQLKAKPVLAPPPAPVPTPVPTAQPAPGALAAVPAPSAAPKPADQAAQDSPMAALKKMMDTPGMKEMMKQQMLTQVELGYGRLFEMLHLNGEEKEQFKQLLAGRLGAATDVGLSMGNGSQTPEEMKRNRDKLVESDATFDRAIHDFLDNENDYKTYLAWQDTQPERMQLNMVGRQTFASAGEPLSAEQEERLVSVMAQARKAPSSLPDMTQPKNFDPSSMTPEVIDRILAQQQEQAKAVAAGAAAFLSPVQQEALAKMQQQYRSMSEAGLRMSSAMFGKKPNP